jgi:hypothetical protein
LGWAEYTKKGVVCQEGKTTRRYEEKVQADIADNDYKSNPASYSKSVSQRGRKSASHLAMSV